MPKTLTDLYFTATQETQTDSSRNAYNPPQVSVVRFFNYLYKGSRHI